MQIQISTAEEVTKVFRNILKQLPYGTMKALNRLALRFQELQRHHQQRVFEVRQKGYWHRAVKIPRGKDGFATIKNLRSRIIIDPPEGKSGAGKRYDIFERQEFGGTRRPQANNKSLAIPSEEVDRTTKGLIKAKDTPKKLKGKRDFVIEFASGKRGLFQRIGPRSKAYTHAGSARSGGRVLNGFGRLSLREDPNVRFLYFLAPKAEIEDVYEFFENAQYVFRNWGDEFLVQEIRRAFKDSADHFKSRGG
jgi:hypothetical protein